MCSLATLAALAVVSTGCSFAFVHGPPRLEERRAGRIDCTELPLAPHLDGLLAGISAYAALSLASTSDAEFRTRHPDSSDSRGDLLTNATVSAVLLGASALYGAYQISACSAAKQSSDEPDGALKRP
jgi:hypothetical protein